MKTKFSYLTLLVIPLLLGFYSCSNNEDGEGVDSKEAKSVFLKISGSTPSTYSEGDPVGNNSTVGFTSGDLYFVNEGGAILKHYTLSSNATNSTNINITTAQGGTEIANLPGSTRAVHIVGNTPGLPVTGNISAVKAQVLEVSAQEDIEEVNLYGSGLLVAPVSPLTVYTCEVTLNPTIARIELTNITGSGVISNFNVDGIFIDNYYKEATVEGTVDAPDLISNGASAGPFNNETTEYPANLKPSIYDFYTSGLSAVSKIAAPATSGDVWGYNLFASSAGSAVPRIIIRLSNIQTSDGSIYSSPQFITVRGFRTVSGSAPLANIKSGEIYNIGAGALTFKETDLAPIPNLSLIDVNVEVTLATWTVVDVTPEL